MSRKAVSLKAKRPNPQFEKWLTEWKNNETNETKQAYYSAALKSLQKFPLPIATGRECIILKGFGEKLCKKLDAKLQVSKHKSEISQLNDHDDDINKNDNEITTDKPINKNTTNTNLQSKQNEITSGIRTSKSSASGSKSKQTSYCPAYRSGGYAILCALYKHHIDNTHSNLNVNENDNKQIGMIKKDIVVNGQRFCDKSFTKKEPNCFYTAWSSMSTLITKQLVTKEGNPAKFALTDFGIYVGRKLYDEAMNDPENAHTVEIEDDKAQETNNVKTGTKRKLQKHPSSSSISGQSQTSQVDSQPIEDVILLPGSFKLFLLVDKQETSGTTKNRNTYDEIIMELNSLSVHYEIRHLKVGDYAWICRQDDTQHELVLPYIVERKRMDDFGSSIKDGRFHEQKFRLKQSGVQNLIYLVESHGNNTHVGLPLSSIYQAATNTLVQDGFMVKFTENIRRTAEYLATFTTCLNNLFMKKTLMTCQKHDLAKCSLDEDLIPLMSFKEFNQSSVKNKALKVSDMFVKQLLQLSGISVDKALAIVDKYPTPRMLTFGYEACDGDIKKMENLLTNVEFGSLGKKIGSAISNTIYQLYNHKQY